MSSRVLYYVSQLLSERAERDADGLAVVSPESTLTFGELNGRADWLADQLTGSDATPDSRIGLCVERSAAWVVGALAILKTGAAYVALDPVDPADRLDYILRDSGVSVVLGSRQTEARVRRPGRQVISLDQLEWPRASGFKSSSERSVHGEDLAYIIYTSGSTGRPKGVQITHDGLRNLVYWHRDAFQVTSADRASQQASPGFDVSVWELWGNLGAGASVHVTDDATRMSPPALLDWLVDREITISFVPPPITEYLIDREWPAGTRLRFLLTGGDTLHRAPRQGLPFQVVNNYGPTEVTVFATSGVVPPAAGPGTLPTIGRAIRGMRTYILDPELRPVPRGEPGELCIEGVGLARGYVNLPEETAAKFIRNPFSDDPTSRLYRSGDRAALLSDGQIAFMGRLDEQAKIRGHRIEPAEISVTLNSHPDVQASAVIASTSDGEQPRLIAYVVGKTGSTLQREPLCAYLAEQLPRYMIPPVFVVMDALPLTKNGKIDRAALPTPTHANTLHEAGRPAGRVRPGTPIERELALLWTRLLSVQQVSARDDFFDLGGDSLTAARLFLDIESTFGIRLPAATLLENATLESLARAVSQRATGTRTPLVALRRSGSRRPLFLVHGIGSEVLGYQSLVRHLSAEQPVYGLQGQGADLPPGSALRVESMAAEYLSAIRDVQADGPYAIGGYSAGGIIAYEIARQVRAAGQQVALLVLLDGDPPGTLRQEPAWTPSRAVRFARNLFHWLIDDLLQSSATDLWSRVQSKTRLLRAGLRPDGSSAGNGRPTADIRDRLGVQRLPRELIPWLEACAEALHAYRPGPYEGKIVLLRARTSALFEPTTPDRGWAALAQSGVEVRTIRGDHATILREPRVRQLARELNRCLDACQLTPRP